MNCNNGRVWWLPLVRRTLGWGALSGIAVGAFFFVLLLFLALISNLGDPSYLRQAGIWGCLLNALRAAIFVGVPAGGIGWFTGLASGFFAPAREPKNPFRSRFFRGVVADTLGFWLLTAFVLVLTAVFVSIVFEPWMARFPWERANYALLACLFVASLWRALNRGLRATQLK